MGFKHLLAASLLSLAAFPAPAAEPWDPRTAQAAGVMYFVRIPLGAESRKEREMVYGLMMRGVKEREFIYLDSKMLHFIDGGISAKFVIAGAVAIGAAVAVGGGGGSNSSQPAAQPARVANTTTTSSTTTSNSTSSSSTSTGTTPASGNTGGTSGGTCPPTPCPK